MPHFRSEAIADWRQKPKDSGNGPLEARLARLAVSQSRRVNIVIVMEFFFPVNNRFVARRCLYLSREC
jgi:hypothetical protein